MKQLVLWVLCSVILSTTLKGQHLTNANEIERDAIASVCQSFIDSSKCRYVLAEEFLDRARYSIGPTSLYWYISSQTQFQIAELDRRISLECIKTLKQLDLLIAKLN